MRYITVTALLSLSLIAGNLTRDNATGIVIDSLNDLEWQDDYSDNNGTIKRTNTKWSEAVTYCEQLTLNGKSNWRLPNINELMSIVDLNKSSPKIKAVFTKIPIASNQISNDYISSTAGSTIDTGRAYMVNLVSGETSNIAKNSGREIVRCVRNK